MLRAQKFETANEYLIKLCEIFKFNINSFTDDELTQLVPLIKSLDTNNLSFGKNSLLNKEGEVIYCLQKRHNLQLLLQGTCKDYHEFTARDHARADIPEQRLTQDEFNELHNELKSFTDAELVELRKSCYMDLEPSQHFLGMDISFTRIIAADGGDRIVAKMQELVRQGVFTERDFALWRWCGLLCLFSMYKGLNANHYTSHYHTVQKVTADELKKVLINPDYPFFINLLAARAHLIQFEKTGLTQNECALLTYIAVKFTSEPILSVEAKNHLIAGYKKFRARVPHADLAEMFHAYHGTNRANARSSLRVLFNKLFSHCKAIEGIIAENAIEKTTEIMCLCLYNFIAIPGDEIVSLLELSQHTPAMLRHINDVTFIFRNGQMVIQYPLTPRQAIAFEAANQGDIEKLKEFTTEESLDTFDADCDGKTPLMVALENGHLEASLMLLNRCGVRNGEKTQLGKTIVEFANEYPACELAAKIIKKEITFSDVCQLTKERNLLAIKATTAIMGDICKLSDDDLDLMTYLVREDRVSDAVWLSDVSYNGPVHLINAYIATENLEKIMQYLADEKDDNRRHGKINCAISKCAEKGYVEVVNQLLLVAQEEQYLNETKVKAIEGYAEGKHFAAMEAIIDAAVPGSLRHVASGVVSKLIRGAESVTDALRIMAGIKYPKIRFQFAMAVPMALAMNDMKKGTSNFFDLDINRLYELACCLRALIVTEGLTYDAASRKLKAITEDERKELLLIINAEDDKSALPNNLRIVYEAPKDLQETQESGMLSKGRP